VHPAVVIANVSGSANTSADEAVLTSIDHNLLYVVPAGNDGGDACANSPARVGPALTVGATGRTDQVYFASNQGTCVDIFAPGEEIPGPSSSDDTTITSAWGTSEAAPHVAGVAATYLAANPTATSIALLGFRDVPHRNDALLGTVRGPHYREGELRRLRSNLYRDLQWRYMHSRPGMPERDPGLLP
jgi:subtilisin family serine protease